MASFGSLFAYIEHAHEKLWVAAQFAVDGVLDGSGSGSRGSTGAGSAGQPGEPAGTISVTSRLVVLDVVVLDHNGKPVTNLDRSVFSVTEDKVPQTIRDFDPPSGHMMPTSAALT